MDGVAAPESPTRLSQVAPVTSASSNIITVNVGSLKKSEIRKQKRLQQRWYKPVIIVSWIIFLAYEVLIGLDNRLSKTPLCPYSDDSQPTYFHFVLYGVLGGFCAIWLLLVLRLLTSENEGPQQRVPLVLALHVNTMSLAATLAAVIWNHGGLCVDQLGVASPAALWGEWGACGPLLLFIPLTMIDKPSVTSLEWTVMVSFFFCIVAGFVVIVPQPLPSAQFFLALSCFFFLPVLLLPWSGGGSLFLRHRKVEMQTENVDGPLGPQHIRRRTLVLTVMFLYTLFALTYFLAVFGVIDKATTVCAFQVISVLTKGIFAATALHVVRPSGRGGSENTQTLLHGAFLEYVLHDVRAPLKAINKGIDRAADRMIQQQRQGQGQQDQGQERAGLENISSMRAATEFLAHTLRMLGSMKKLEDGSLAVSLQPMCIDSVARQAVAAFAEVAKAKEIGIVVEVETRFPGLPAGVLGSALLLEHAISQLLSNALMRAPEGRPVTLSLVCERTGTSAALDGALEASILICVAREGEAVSPADQALLSFCRRVVALHGGELSFKGPKASVSIPFAVVAGAQVKRVTLSVEAQQQSFVLPPELAGTLTAEAAAMALPGSASLPVFNLATMQFEAPEPPKPIPGSPSRASFQSPVALSRASFQGQLPSSAAFMTGDTRRSFMGGQPMVDGVFPSQGGPFDPVRSSTGPASQQEYTPSFITW